MSDLYTCHVHTNFIKWAQDAARLGSLMKGKPDDEIELKEMLINNLTWLHLGTQKSGPRRTVRVWISIRYTMRYGARTLLTT